jgi:hypothetical protein
MQTYKNNNALVFKYLPAYLTASPALSAKRAARGQQYYFSKNTTCCPEG